MHSLTKRLFAVAVGLAAAIALGAPAGAQAATSTPTVRSITAASPYCNDTNGQNFFVANAGFAAAWGNLHNSGAPQSQVVLYFTGTQAHRLPFCATAFGGVIFTDSAGNCLAYNSIYDDVYEHNTAGCTSATPPDYMSWTFVLIQPDPAAYEFQIVYQGNTYCLWENTTNGAAYVDPCDDSSLADLFEMYDILQGSDGPAVRLFVWCA